MEKIVGQLWAGRPGRSAAVDGIDRALSRSGGGRLIITTPAVAVPMMPVTSPAQNQMAATAIIGRPTNSDQPCSADKSNSTIACNAAPPLGRLKQFANDGGDRNAALFSVRGGRFQVGLELCTLRAAIENGGAILNHDQNSLVMKIARVRRHLAHLTSSVRDGRRSAHAKFAR